MLADGILPSLPVGNVLGTEVEGGAVLGLIYDCAGGSIAVGVIVGMTDGNATSVSGVVVTDGDGTVGATLGSIGCNTSGGKIVIGGVEY